MHQESTLERLTEQACTTTFSEVDPFYFFPSLVAPLPSVKGDVLNCTQQASCHHGIKSLDGHSVVTWFCPGSGPGSKCYWWALFIVYWCTLICMRCKLIQRLPSSSCKRGDFNQQMAKIFHGNSWWIVNPWTPSSRELGQDGWPCLPQLFLPRQKHFN